MLLFFATIWPNVQMMGYEILRAKNMHRFSALVYAAVAIANAIISIPLCMWLEGLGAAIGTMIATFVGNVLIINWYYYRYVGLNIPRFWKKIFQLLPSMAVPLLAAIAIAIWAPVNGYLGVVLWGAAFVAVYAFFLWFFGMNRYERDLIAGPVRKILRRFGR
jgi:O-antigen/teichoic acid export membrane protein